MTGTVKNYDAKLGFGFIVPDQGGKDVFVHHSNIAMDGFRVLEEKQHVEFEVESTPRGLNAKNVIVIGDFQTGNVRNRERTMNHA
jgi:CspA family cold shock protein